jgi:hypothetical protein
MVRFPRTSRFEYVFDFLEGLDEGASQEQIEDRLGKRRMAFQSEKYAALGRGAPFSEKQKRRLLDAKETFNECAKLSYRLGFTDRLGTTLTEPGERLVRLPREERVPLLMQTLFESYPIFKTFLLALKGAPSNEIQLPDTRHTPDSGSWPRFRELARKSGLDVDMLTFAVMRDLLWQAGYVNWYTEKRPVNGKSSSSELWYRVYLTATLTTSGGGEGCPVSFQDDRGRYFVGVRDVDGDLFNGTLWQEYLRRTNDVPLRPVFYAELRTATCSRLHISDRVFDEQIGRLLRTGTPFNVVWSSGTLPYSKEAASLLKNLPPKSADGQYMVYLKIGRK